MAALEIASRKKLIIKEKVSEALQPAKKKNEFENSIDFINKKIDQIYAIALGNKIELITSVSGKEALKDVMLLLACMNLDNEEILIQSQTQKLYLIIADIVLGKMSEKLANKMGVVSRDKKKDENK